MVDSNDSQIPHILENSPKSVTGVYDCPKDVKCGCRTQAFIYGEVDWSKGTITRRLLILYCFMSFNLNTASAACPVSHMTELREFLMGHVRLLKVVMARAFFGQWCYF